MFRFSKDPTAWSNDELRWIDDFRSAQILALGEAVHTSDGFYSAKVRLIQYLVENCHFRAISFETPWGRALSATRFIEEGRGTVKDALNGIFRVWRAKSVERLFLWLRQWNQDHPQDPVRFFGNDTQQADWDLNFLLTSDLVPAKSKTQLRKLVTQTFDEDVFNERYPASETFKKLLIEGFSRDQDQASEIVTCLNELSLPENSQEFVSRISLAAEVSGLAKQVYGTAKDLVEARRESFACRDRCMSDLTLHLGKGEKTILWAHNIHIAHPPADGIDAFSYQGQFLKNVLGDNYKAIALTACKIEINWPWISADMWGPLVLEDSLERSIASRFPEQSVFLAHAEDFDSENYSCGEYHFKDGDISYRFDGLIVLPESQPIEYAIGP